MVKCTSTNKTELEELQNAVPMVTVKFERRCYAKCTHWVPNYRILPQALDKHDPWTTADFMSCGCSSQTCSVPGDE